MTGEESCRVLWTMCSIWSFVHQDIQIVAQCLIHFIRECNPSVCTMMHIVSVECSNKYRVLSMWRRAAIGWLTARCSQLTNDRGLTTLTGHTLVTIGQMQRPGPQWPLVSTGGGALGELLTTYRIQSPSGGTEQCVLSSWQSMVLSFFIPWHFFSVERVFLLNLNHFELSDLLSMIFNLKVHYFNLAFHDK